MKAIFFMLVLLVYGLCLTSPQLAKTGADINSIRPTQKINTLYQLVDKSIEIPSPEGFEEASSQLKAIKDRFEATEDPNNEVLAVHIPKETLYKLKSGEPDDLTFYTKISVNKRLKGRNMTPSEFSQMVSIVRSINKEIFDINNPRNRAAIKDMENNLSELNEKETKLNFSQPVNLGEFESSQNIYSMMLLIKMNPQIGGQQREVVLLAATSFVKVKQRLLYVYTYKRFKTADDIELLKSFTKKWTNQIIMANQN